MGQKTLMSHRYVQTWRPKFPHQNHWRSWTKPKVKIIPANVEKERSKF